MEIRHVDEPTPAQIAFMHDRIDEYNIAVTGYDDGQWLTFLVYDQGDATRATDAAAASDTSDDPAQADDRPVIAGLHGWTWGGAAWVDVLWVDEVHRATGIGSQLLQRAEDTARARGCDLIALGTHTFQARPFYERHGYEMMGFLPDYPRRHGLYTMRKHLGTSTDP